MGRGWGKGWGKQRAMLRGPARHTLLSKGPRRRRKRRRSEAWGWAVGVSAAIGIGIYWYIVFGVVDPAHERQGGAPPPPRAAAPDVVSAPADTHTPAAEPFDVVREAIVNTAKGMVARGVRWDGGYHVMRYPGGDLSPDAGTSVDVLVRALRGANIDLQQLIHEDRVANPEHYPLHRWRRKTPDTNIDHRRLANVWAFFNRYAVRLDASTSRDSLTSWKPGDVVFWGEGRMDLPTHVGIISDRKSPAGVPYVIDLHKDDGVISDARLVTDRPIMGHYRVSVERLPEPGAPIPGRPRIDGEAGGTARGAAAGDRGAQR